MKFGEPFVFYKGTQLLLGTYKNFCSKCGAICYEDAAPIKALVSYDVAMAGETNAEEISHFVGHARVGICKKCAEKL